MLRLLALVFAGILAVPLSANAQKGQQIFDLMLQGAQQEVQRQQQRDYERQQRQHLQQLHQQYVAQWQACHGGDLTSCNVALTYPYANETDRQVLLNKRSELIAIQQEAATRAYRERLAAEAAERERIREQSRVERHSDATRVLGYHQENQSQSASTLPAPWASFFAIFAVVVVLTAGILGGGSMMRFFGWDERLNAAGVAAVASFRQSSPFPSQQPDAAAAPSSEAVPTPPPQPAAPDIPRDTPGAVAALELALAYIQEVRDDDTPGLDDVAGRKQQLNTLSLATKQLARAEELDPDAIFEGQGDDGSFRFTINELKAEALLLEGTTHEVYDIHRAIPALYRATELNPQSARAFYVLGLAHAANMNKAHAVTNLEKAVALDPKNITFRKELDRAQNMTAGEIAAYRVTRAGERVVDGGVKAWNIFAIVWNIVTFPLRLVVGIFRLLRLHPFA